MNLQLKTMLTTKKIIKRFHPTLKRGGLSRQEVVKSQAFSYQLASILRRFIKPLSGIFEPA